MARYSNGQSRPAGQIEIASFRNPQGLQPLGGNAWARSFTSGDPVLGTPGTGNFGVMQSGALEESNVDLTGELVNMITAQRIYQANAQTIKTIDQTMQTLVNMR
jgi:flagellar hook protein FlgE